MSTLPTKQRLYFANLDGLRFLAFLFVYLHHSFHTEIPAIKESAWVVFAEGLFKNGEVGVNFFFVLSGFLISYLLFYEKNLMGKINVPYFYMRRFLRIWPLYFAVVLFGFIGFPLLKSVLGGVPNETADPWYYVFFLSNFNDLYNGLPDASVLGVLWSVGIEEQFYLIWPLLLLLVPKKWLMPLFGLILLASFGFRWEYADSYVVRKYHTLSAISDMTIGGMSAYWCFYREEFVRRIAEFPKKATILVYLLGIGLVFFHQHLLVHPILIASSRLVLSLFFAFVVLEQTFGENSFYKIGNWKWISYWGKYTYGLYMLHFVAILIVINLSKILGIAQYVWGVLLVEMPLGLGFSFALSWLSYHLFERPFLRLKDRFAYIVKGK